MVELHMEKGAVISICEKYRYKLWRIWDKEKPKLLFIMLNPSTADANIDDATIRRCIRFANSWGYGSIYVGNLFAYRSTYPKDLLLIADPVGADNLMYISEMCYLCDDVVYAWGDSVPKGVKCNSLAAIRNKPIYNLGLNKSGNPKHPLYLPLTTKMQKVQPLKRYI